MKPVALDTRLLTSFDGTSIAYHATRGDGPAIVLANGLGGTYSAWRHQIDYLADRFRFISWDYRGLYDSSRPPGDDFAIAAHARDLLAVLDATSVGRAAFMGWSMGVQVLLEVLRVAPDRASHLVLLNGTFGDPFRTVGGVPGAGRVVPVAVDLLRRAHPICEALLRRAAEWPELGSYLKRVGFVGPTLDDDLFGELVRSFGQLDMDAYFRTLRELGRHDASDVLEKVAVPTLVIAGDRDFFTPRALAHSTAQRIPDAELFVVHGGSHYVAVEFPELVNLRIEKFLRERGFG